MVKEVVSEVAKEVEAFNNNLIQYFSDAREKGADNIVDFDKQQELYRRYAHVYDKGLENGYNAYKIVSRRIMELYPDQKDIKILDFGCGTGLTADFLSDYGYTNIDGLDPCKDIMDVAQTKGKMKNFYELRCEDDDSVIPTDQYDVVCASGVFYTSPSHPGFTCIPKVCRYVKPGGHIIICSGKHYFETTNPTKDYKVIEELSNQGKIKAEKKIVDDYRKPMHEVEGEKTMQGALFDFEVL